MLVYWELGVNSIIFLLTNRLNTKSSKSPNKEWPDALKHTNSVYFRHESRYLKYALTAFRYCLSQIILHLYPGCSVHWKYEYLPTCILSVLCIDSMHHPPLIFLISFNHILIKQINSHLLRISLLIIRILVGLNLAIGMHNFVYMFEIHNL